LATLFVKDLTVIDFSYLDTRRGVVGDSWIVDVALHGNLNAQSFVLDFGLVKKSIKRFLDTWMDHKLVVPTLAKGFCLKKPHRFHFEFTDFDKSFLKKELNKEIKVPYIDYSAPSEALLFLETPAISVENVLPFLLKELRAILPGNVEDVEVTLRKEQTPGEYYHYSHGLKKHDGNCQRMIHGHRSTIEIWENGNRSQSKEQDWCARWKDIYLGSQEDLVAESKDVYHFVYTSSQGEFRLAISKTLCELIPTDSTVECLAEYIATEVQKSTPDASITVVAYEGVGKGAKASV
jgi:6-pyruvoyl-tetrahydropterin synthase